MMKRFHTSLALVGLVLACSFASGEESGSWYPFYSTAPTDPGVIGMNDWLDAPAGRLGRIERVGGELVYGGKPIKIWGLNNTFKETAPSNEMARKRAAFYAKYGVNSVRLHKYGDGTGWAGILNGRSFSEFDPEGLDRMDYFINELKQKGIFVKLSASFGPPRLMPEDLKTVPFAEEFGSIDEGRGSITVPHSAIFYSPEIQDIHIRQTINLLNHHNPYTGMTYAEDPAIWDVEIINEQSVLFFTSPNALKESPTLRKSVAKRFSAWLEQRYGDEKGLLAAWGKQSLNCFEIARDESLEAGTIVPFGNPYYWNAKTLDGPESMRRQRHLDTMEFLTGLQVKFYNRFVDAVRETGYTGEISGSNWQAGSSFSHFANLWTDALIGTIDRHNYFGGLQRKKVNGQRLVNNGSMLARAGSGMLSSGMQQVADLPFMLSEWIHVWPNDWGVEGPAIIGAYGMGLQGWDVSYMFQNYDNGEFSPVLGGHNWDVSVPQVMGTFPAISRQVLRGDIELSSEVVTLNVHAPSLFKGSGFDFVDQVDQGYDDKVLQTDKVGPAALAAARVEVAFTDKPESTRQFKLERFLRDGGIESSTGELFWKEASTGITQGGYFTIDTPGTQALVGFAEGVQFDGSHATIRLKSRYGAVYLTALDKDEVLAGAKRILVTAFARARNTGQAFDPQETVLLEAGEGPVLMEPVELTISIKRGQPFKVLALDHDGRIDQQVATVDGGSVFLDTGKWKTPYFVIEFQ
ncbi:MAG: hypothetical protein AB3N63_19465 [Puniceicoccaceae bacterium]